MKAVRTRVRAIALLWLLGQVAALSAFVPENCCVSHIEERAAKEKKDACHESEPAPEPGDACPMQHETGAACPMHAGKPTDRCAMSNACAGPGTHLITLFAYLGAIERPASTGITLESTAAIERAAPAPLFRFISPDSPPPKA